MRAACLTLVIFFGFTLSACIPLSRVSAPKIQGEILDASSNQPILGAVVYYKEYPVKKILTAMDGGFDLPEFRERFYQPLGPAVDLGPAKGTLVIQAEGYETQELMVNGNPYRSEGKRVEIHMKRK